MNPLTELDHLNLDSATKTQVAVMTQSLLDQAERDAKTIQAKDFKIEALTHEVAYYRRIRALKVKRFRLHSVTCLRKPGTRMFPPLMRNSNN